MGEINNSTLVFAAAGTTVTYFMKTGNDTASNIYFSPNTAGQAVARVVIRPSDTITITKINGLTLKDPIPVTTTGYNPEYLPGLRYSEVEILTDNTNTKIDFTVFWVDSG